MANPMRGWTRCNAPGGHHEAGHALVQHYMMPDQRISGSASFAAPKGSWACAPGDTVKSTVSRCAASWPMMVSLAGHCA
jgi:hypothetical protein